MIYRVIFQIGSDFYSTYSNEFLFCDQAPGYVCRPVYRSENLPCAEIVNNSSLYLGLVENELGVEAGSLTYKLDTIWHVLTCIVQDLLSGFPIQTAIKRQISQVISNTSYPLLPGIHFEFPLAFLCHLAEIYGILQDEQVYQDVYGPIELRHLTGTAARGPNNYHQFVIPER